MKKYRILIYAMIILGGGIYFLSLKKTAPTNGSKEVVTKEAKKKRRHNFPKTLQLVEKLPNPDSLYIFFMAGQSNMAGRGFVEPADTIPNKRILSIDENNNWVYAKEPLHFYEPSKNGLDCGVSFANTLLESLPEGVSIAVIPCAVGGSPIEKWLNNKTYRGLKLLDNFKQKVRLVEGYGEIKGVIWHQGESDAKPGLISMYPQRLDSLISVFRDIVKNDNLPIVLGELASYSEPKEKQIRWDSINTIIHRAVAKGSYLAIIETSDLKDKGDKVHFDSKSQRKLGERFALKYLELTNQAGPKLEH